MTLYGVILKDNNEDEATRAGKIIESRFNEKGYKTRRETSNFWLVKADNTTTKELGNVLYDKNTHPDDDYFEYIIVNFDYYHGWWGSETWEWMESGGRGSISRYGNFRLAL